jgi:hypothetical protein
MQFYGISFMYQYKQSGHRQDVLDNEKNIYMHFVGSYYQYKQSGHRQDVLDNEKNIYMHFVGSYYICAETIVI